jgi:hypothetical protein
MKMYALHFARIFGLCSFLAWSANAAATVIALNPTSQGWINQNGEIAPAYTQGNYIAGNCGFGGCGIGEYRNFFNFILPLFSGTISSARFEFNTFDIFTVQNPSITYGMFATTSTANFADLGTGVEYGSRTFSSNDSNQTFAIDLNSDALDDILQHVGSNFSISGRVTSPTAFGPNQTDQFVFGSSWDLIPITLEITYDETEIPVAPTPLLIVLGLASLGRARRRSPAVLGNALSKVIHRRTTSSTLHRSR